MRQERYVIYAELADDVRDEYQWCRTLERARTVAADLSRELGVITGVDWVEVEISSRGVETLDCEADLAAFAPDGKEPR